MSKLDNVKSFSASLDAVQVTKGMTPKNKALPNDPFGQAVEAIAEANEDEDDPKNLEEDLGDVADK